MSAAVRGATGPAGGRLGLRRAAVAFTRLKWHLLLGGLRGSTQQRVQTVQQQIDDFAKTHPRVAELEADMAFFLKSGRAKDLSEAYDLAERLNPAPKPSAAHTGNQPALAQTQAPAPAPVNPAGQKSISGAPTTGSNPVGMKGPTPSIREALKNAKARVG